MTRIGRTIIASALAIVPSCGRTAAPASPSAPAPASVPRDSISTGPAAGATSPQRLDTAGWVDSTLASLSLRERVGQMVMFWTLGDYTAVDDSTFAETLAWVEKDGVGGITMSLGTPIEVAAKLNYMQRRAKVPLLVAADLEPNLMRLEAAVFPHNLLETGGATGFTSAMALAATGRDEDGTRSAPPAAFRPRTRASGR